MAHEVGHLVVARALGLRVTDLSVGLGPSVFKRVVRGVTFRVGLIPFGGYVAVLQLALADTGRPDEAEAGRFQPRATASRLAAILAGSGANALVAAALVVAVTWTFGRDTGQIVGLEVTATSSRTDAVVHEGDVITAVAGRHVDRVRHLTEGLASGGGDPVELTIERRGRALPLTVVPVQRGERWGLGAHYVVRPELARATLVEALGEGVSFPFRQAGRLVERWSSMILRPDDGVRPVTTVGLVDRVSRSGRWDLRRGLTFAAILSVAVGLFNLLPVPGLDGGRLVLELIETGRRARLPRKTALAVQVSGALVLLILWVILVARDALTFFGAP